MEFNFVRLSLSKDPAMSEKQALNDEEVDIARRFKRLAKTNQCPTFRQS
jgi:hypothetical protein